MGRMWQTLLLYHWNDLFGWLPIETLIRERQEEYYKVLGVCDKKADSDEFIEFMLITIHDALNEIIGTDQVTDQVRKLLDCLKDEELTARELMERLSLKHRQTFSKNYLKPAIAAGYIEMTIPDKPNSNKQRYRKKLC